MSIVEQAGKAMLSMDITGKYHINRPDLWPLDTVINFSGKLRGYRKEGTVTAAANANVTIPILDGLPSCRIYQVGGGWDQGGGPGNNLGLGALLNTTGAVVGNFRVDYIQSVGKMQAEARSTSARSNAPYHIWVLYTVA